MSEISLDFAPLAPIAPSHQDSAQDYDSFLREEPGTVEAGHAKMRHKNKFRRRIMSFLCLSAFLLMSAHYLIVGVPAPEAAPTDMLKDGQASTSQICQDGTCKPTRVQEEEIFTILYNFIETCNQDVAFYPDLSPVLPAEYDNPSDCVALMIQTAFHDCATYASPVWMVNNPLDVMTGTGQVGGCHACVFVECTGNCFSNNVNNIGIKPMVKALKHLYFSNNLETVSSLADFMVRAADVAIFHSTAAGAVRDATAVPAALWGRQDCPVAFANKFLDPADPTGLTFLSFTFTNPIDPLTNQPVLPVNGPTFPNREPNADAGIQSIDKVMRERTGSIVSRRQVSGLIGAHTIGRMYHFITGFAGSWTGATTFWDGSDYYSTLISYPWIVGKVPVNPLAPNQPQPPADRLLWVKTGDENMLLPDWLLYDKSFTHADMAIYFDVTEDIYTEPATNNDCGNGCGTGIFSNVAGELVCGSCGTIPRTSPNFPYAQAASDYSADNILWRNEFKTAWNTFTSLGTQDHCDASFNVAPPVLDPLNPNPPPTTDPLCYPALAPGDPNFVPQVPPFPAPQPVPQPVG